MKLGDPQRALTLGFISGHRWLEEGSPVNTIKATAILYLLLNLTVRLNHNTVMYSLLGRCPVDMNNSNSGENKPAASVWQESPKRKRTSHPHPLLLPPASSLLVRAELTYQSRLRVYPSQDELLSIPQAKNLNVHVIVTLPRCIPKSSPLLCTIIL